jgi:hypothetical protein
MDILVICHGCNAKFKVSEKFAGKKGPCPKCKVILTIPDPQEVKIHEPEAFAEGGKSAAGKLVTKPIERTKTRIQPLPAALAAVGTVLVLAGSWFGGELLQEMVALRGLGLILVSLPLTLAAYTFLRNDELEPYRRTELLIRAGICAAVYALLWGVFAFLPESLTAGESYIWFMLAPPFLVVGALVAMGSLDLDFGSGFFHYTFYVGVTLLLRWLAGMPPIWTEVV